MKHAFIIPGLGISRAFDTEEEAIMRRMSVAEAIEVPIEYMDIVLVSEPEDKPQEAPQ
jgi:hypothetical protein